MLLNAKGGSIGIESRLGVFTRVTVLLPAVGEKENNNAG